MAFVNATPLKLSAPVPTLRSSAALDVAKPTRVATANGAVVRMGYGDYSYATDKTKGHVNQYYVDKFRITSDWTKGTPKSDANAILGRNAKGGVAVPKEGIAQEFDDALPPRDDTVPEDPRIAESEGAVYRWDPNYVDPQFLPSAYANVNDADVADTAFAQFRASMWESRGSSLSAMDFGAQARIERIKAGIDERYLMTLDGQLDARPMTEIPGTPYCMSVGAVDFIDKNDGDSVAFWKTGSSKVTTPVNYKKPSGSETPELAYNTAVTPAQLQEAQKVREGVLLITGSQEE